MCRGQPRAALRDFQPAHIGPPAVVKLVGRLRFTVVVRLVTAVNLSWKVRYRTFLRLNHFTKKLSNFRGLVLGCIDSYDSNQIVILQGFSRSTRFAILCTAQISKFQQKFVKRFFKFCLNFGQFASFQHFFIEFCTDSDENFSEFRWIL